MKAVGKAAIVGALLVAMVGSFILGTGGAQSACGATAADPAAAATHPEIAGYAGDQLVNAATIMNAGAALGLDTTGQTIGVMTAMGESSLRNLTYGDIAGPDSRGLFQQRDGWGTLADRLDPTTAATLFFQGLISVPGWQRMTPTGAAHTVQHNADPDHYTRYYEPARTVVAGLLGADAACAAGVGSNAQALAQNLVAAVDAGRIVGSVPDHLQEIRWMAEGRDIDNCTVDVRVLQIITIAYNTFGKLGISDINRRCSGQLFASGTSSAHYANGGGHAVDFYSLGGIPATGADPNSTKLLQILDPLMSEGSGAGQSNCRTLQGVPLMFTHFRQFRDSCTHLHLNVSTTNTDPLRT